MMKLALFGLFCLEAALAVTPSKELEEWEAWKQQYGRSYSTKSQAGEGSLDYDNIEEGFRMKIWLENKAAIEKHNREYNEGLHTFKLAINEFSDLRVPEFASKMNGIRPRPREAQVTEGGSAYQAPASVTLPDSVDWREKGAVTPVKKQECNDCWAFAATGALEAALQIKTGKLVSLSEQQLVDCSGQSEQCPNGKGGDVGPAFDYIKNNGGLDTEESYPYEGTDGKCRYKESDIGAKVIGFKTIQAGDENALKSAIATQGPCSVYIYSDYRVFKDFAGGSIFSDEACSKDPKDQDHGVLVVGYGTEAGQDYWLIKNSWGTSWADGGYVKLARNVNMCGVANNATFPLVESP